MSRKTILAIGGATLLVAAGFSAYVWNHYPELFPKPAPRKGGGDTYEVERTDYTPPPVEQEDVLTDDRLEDKKVVPFNPALVDRRPLGEWLVDSSAAVIGLDVPMLLPDAEKYLLSLHPSYASAIKSVPGAQVLPSVNLIDGKAKQFDDGLYAALDQAYYGGLQNRLQSHVQLVQQMFDRVGPASPAAPFLAAGLEIAGVKVEVADAGAKGRFISDFESTEVLSKPIGFYNWSKQLGDCFRFLRFFQHRFERDLTIPNAIAKAMTQDQALLNSYEKALDFYSHLTNPFRTLPVSKLIANPQGGHDGVALFPGSTSKEVLLFEKLFPTRLPPEANLMRELIRRIRSGEVNLAPGPNSGWYDYQVYALETLLLPEKGAEHDKLVLTRAYKKRMLEAFQALMTKRRETHVRQLDFGEAKSMAAPRLPDKVQPRLRLEPNLTYYLRTARAYSFLANFLESAVGKEALQTLHGLRKQGPRSATLYNELHSMRNMYYGFYLIGAEDIGLAPALNAEEAADTELAYKLADDWLAKAFQDPDLAEDTRVAVPIYVDPMRGSTRMWLTLGVRLTKLDANYFKPPSLKPARGAGNWQPVATEKLEASHYVLPVDEIAEVELRGMKVLTRDELRAVCDREKTKEAILAALSK